LGCLGFLKAITNFNESYNVKFSTYAVPMIAGEVKRFLRDNGIIKVSRSTKQLNMHIGKYIEQYVSIYEKSPSIDQIATEFDITKQEVVYAMESSRLPVSLSAVISDDVNKEMSILEKIADEDNTLDKHMDNQLLYSIINDLPKRDKKIIILRYFRDKTQKEIALELGVSQVQISRLENKILSMIKNKYVQ
jgi:RNA polymerase sporulation-specific sigma factor